MDDTASKQPAQIKGGGSQQERLHAIPVLSPDNITDLFFEDRIALRRLAHAVIVQAARDAEKGDQEAIAWLLHPDTDSTWITLADLDRRAIERWINAGCKTSLCRNGLVKKYRGTSPGKLRARLANQYRKDKPARKW
jgi:hypothetical protein